MLLGNPQVLVCGYTGFPGPLSWVINAEQALLQKQECASWHHRSIWKAGCVIKELATNWFARCSTELLQISFILSNKVYSSPQTKSYVSVVSLLQKIQLVFDTNQLLFYFSSLEELVINNL